MLRACEEREIGVVDFGEARIIRDNIMKLTAMRIPDIRCRSRLCIEKRSVQSAPMRREIRSELELTSSGD